MCISLISTSHPNYPFILLNNRDEFLARPTSRAHWWDSPNQHVLGGRDLQRQIRGTWLAITKQGRVANLTNFRDEGAEVALNRSRGGLVNAYVTTPPDSEEDDEAFVQRLVEEMDVRNVGGFTLLFGRLRKPREGKVPGLAVVSNRTSSTQEVKRLCTKLGETDGLSNSHYGDRSWPKIVQGEELLQQAIRSNVDKHEDKDTFISNLFELLSTDTLPRPEPGEPFQSYTRQLRNSILIPPVGGESVESKPADKLASADGTETPDHGSVKVGQGVYGTQRQTVVLVDREGQVTSVERALFDGDGEVGEAERETRVEFGIEGWEG